MGQLLSKLKNVAISLLPLIAIVLILHFSVAKLENPVVITFLLASVLVCIGQVFFLVGVDNSIMSMGQLVGTNIHKLKKSSLIILFGFIFGFAATIAEPSVQVLAKQVQQVNPTLASFTLIIVVSLGVGIFVALSFVKILFKIKLRTILVLSYILVFILMALAPKSFVAIAFDSGGVTTGPITVPFILSLGMGVASAKSESKSEDSFGLIALASIGPIISVLLLSNIIGNAGGPSIVEEVVDGANKGFFEILTSTMLDVFVGLAPMFVIFMLFELIFLKLPLVKLSKVFIGVLVTYIGLVLFLAGVDWGFSNAGQMIGVAIGDPKYQFLAILVGALIGFIVVFTEPAIAVLGKQVENATNRLVKSSTIIIALAIALTGAMIISILRIIFEIDIMFIILPGYALCIILLFFTDELFSNIAFDSGGIATGPMTSTFIVPFLMGIGIGANSSLNAFGSVSLIAMMPIMTIQILGLITKIRLSTHIVSNINMVQIKSDFDFGSIGSE